MDIRTYNISDHITDRLMRTYKKSLPNVQRFFETKLEVNLQEQETEFQEKEKEITELEQQTETLEAKINESKQWFGDCVVRTSTLGSELQRTYVLKSALREERKSLENLTEKASSDDKHEELVSKFCDGMHSIIDYIETAEQRREQLEHKLNCGDDDDDDCGQIGKFGTNGKTITSKVQGVVDLITAVMEKTVGPEAKEIDMEQDIRLELEKTVYRLREIIKDLSYVKRIFLTTLRKKEDLSQETLSLVHNFREIRRLEKEMTEKQGHIQELKTRGQTIKNKSKRHKRYLEQIQEEIGQKEKQLTEVCDHLQKQVSSADQRVHFILSLLPDSGEAEGPKAIADDTKSEAGFSCFSRAKTQISVLDDRSDSRFSLQSEKTDVTMSKVQATSTPAPPKTPAPPSQTPAVTDSRVAPLPKKQSEGNENKAKSASNQGKPPAEANGSKLKNGSSNVQDVEKLKSEGSQQTLKTFTTHSKTPNLSFSARNKVQPMGSTREQSGKTQSMGSLQTKVSKTPDQVQSDRAQSLGTVSEQSKSGNTTPRPEKAKSNILSDPKSEVKRRLTVGSLTAGMEMTREVSNNELRSTTPDDKSQANLIKVKPAEDSNTIKSKSAKTVEVTKPTVQANQRVMQSKQNPSEKQNQQNFPKTVDRFSMKEPLSISSTRSARAPPSDGKSPSGYEKGTHRSPVPTPRYSMKGSVTQHSTMADRPVPAIRTKRMNSTDEKDIKHINGAATPRILNTKDDIKQPWTAVSSKQLLKPQNGENDALLTPNCTYPPTKRQSRAKSMDHVMLGSRADSLNKEMTQNESVYARVNDAINKVKERSSKETGHKDQMANNAALPEGRAFANPRLSLSTESSEGQMGDHNSWSSEDSSQLSVNGSRNDATGDGIGVGFRSASNSRQQQQILPSDLEFEEIRARRPRTSSAETTMSGSRGRQQGEDPNKYPQRQILMASKVELT